VTHQPVSYVDRIDAYRGEITQCSADGQLIVRAYRSGSVYWVTDDTTAEIQARGSDRAAILVDVWVRNRRCPVPSQQRIPITASSSIA
jgi:hypothetical protein